MTAVMHFIIVVLAQLTGAAAPSSAIENITRNVNRIRLPSRKSSMSVLYVASFLFCDCLDASGQLFPTACSTSSAISSGHLSQCCLGWC
jgi:hypothetical protein